MTPEERVAAIWDKIHSVDICEVGFADEAKRFLASAFGEAATEATAAWLEKDKAERKSWHECMDNMVRASKAQSKVYEHLKLKFDVATAALDSILDGFRIREESGWAFQVALEAREKIKEMEL